MSESKEEKLPFELTESEKKIYADKCADLEKELNVPRVHCCVQLKQDGGHERIVSYISEPNYVTKIALMDKASAIGSMMAAEELRMLYQIKEHSHFLTFGETADCDFYKLGVTRFCQDIIIYATNQYKKK